MSINSSTRINVLLKSSTSETAINLNDKRRLAALELRPINIISGGDASQTERCGSSFGHDQHVWTAAVVPGIFEPSGLS